MLLLTVLNNSLKVWLVCFGSVARVWSNTGVQGVVSVGHGCAPSLVCCWPLGVVLWPTFTLPAKPCPLAPCQLSRRCSTLHKSAANTQTVRKQRGLESGPSLYGFVLFEGICFISRSHHAHWASDVLRSVFRIQLKESWSTAKQRILILWLKKNELVSKHYKVELVPRGN